MKGDIVCAFLGCDVPLLVRPDMGTDTAKIAGSCYLHGINMKDYVDDGFDQRSNCLDSLKSRVGISFSETTNV